MPAAPPPSMRWRTTSAALLEEARKGLGGKPVAPHSAGKPTVNLYNRGKPATATVTGNFRLTDAAAEIPTSGTSSSISAISRSRFWKARASASSPPGVDAGGNAHHVRGCIPSPARATARNRTPTTSRSP